MDAYDYDNQVWVAGDDGRRLRIKQLQDERGIIMDHGQKYLDSINCPMTLVEAMGRINDQLAELGA